MSRTFRKPTHRFKSNKGLKQVKDGSPTHVSGSCENHGSCPYCKGNRLYKHEKQPKLKDFDKFL